MLGGLLGWLMGDVETIEAKPARKTPEKRKGQHREKVLSDAAVRAAKPGFHPDGNGLYLKVDPSGAKRWIQRLVVRGERRDIGLGSAKLVALKHARAAALANRTLARDGGDPLAARRQAEAVLSFEAAARKVHDLHKDTWRNPKHGQQWINTLEKHVFPHIGTKRIDAVSSADVLEVLTPIWNKNNETARRVRQRIGTVLKWAMAQGWRSDNPAETITRALPKYDRSKVQHRKALPYTQVADALKLVRESPALPTSKLAFEFLVLTATRSAETRLATWSEIDGTVWTIPGSRMKTKKPHRVPLSPACLKILEQAKAFKGDKTDLIFTGRSGDKALSDMTLSQMMKDLSIDAVPHGFRSSFRDWAGEQTSFPREVMEFALAHVIKDKSEAAYARSDLFERRRKLMDAWASYLDGSKVVKFAKVRA